MWLNLLIVLVVLGYGSYTDLKRRSVSNLLCFSGLGIVSLIYTLTFPDYTVPEQAVTLLFAASMPIVAGLGLARGKWAEGDVVLLIFLGLALPFHAYPALLIASLTATLFSRKVKEVPYIPFLLVGVLLSLLITPLLFPWTEMTCLVW